MRVLVLLGLCDFVTCVDIFVTHDVILSEIGTGLNFDQVKLYLAGVFQSMDRTEWDIDRLVFRNEFHVIVDRHMGGTLDHDPMLGPMHMALQG